MPLTVGTRLGPYEILAPIGAGGMGEVYRGKDTRLDREVAIKVLPATLAQDPERLARFEREAKVLASFNHPNIAQIFGLEEDGETHGLAMELVAGSTLSVPQPLEAALNFACQIAEALEAAHERGITHRDLKPANIMITPDGVAKVLDFGLASAPEREAGDPANSPTMATQSGVIMGTAAYMSPEQAAGKPVDRRADIWSFGVVLWEMLTGRMLFPGETVSHILAAVLTAPVDFTRLPASTPAPIAELLRRCLDRNLKNRLQAIGEARIAIQKYLADPAGATAVPRRPVVPLLGWIAAAVLAAACITAGVAWYRVAWRAEPTLLMRLDVVLGQDLPPASPRGANAILSPDGTRLVYVSQGRLFARNLEQSTPAELAGSDGAFAPFFSPDGQWLAFFAGGKLKKLSIGGGTLVTLCDAPNGYGGSWGEDGYVIASLSAPGPLSRIPASGGAPVPLAEMAPGEFRGPQILPGGKAVLFASSSVDGTLIEAMSLQDHRRKTLLKGGDFARYVATAGGAGHLLFLRNGSLFGVAFDPDALDMRGTPVPLVEHISYPFAVAGAASGPGTLLYRSGGAAGTRLVTVQWLGADGKMQALLGKPGVYERPHLSPDGRRLALEMVEGPNRDVWVYEVQRGALTRLTFDVGGLAMNPVWSPDGRYIVFGGRGGMFWIRSDGGGTPQPLSQSRYQQVPFSFTPDGKRLAFMESKPSGGYALWTTSIEMDGTSLRRGSPEMFLQSRYDDRQPTFSPDGHWMAYVSNESGTYQVYVRAFPDAGGKWQISSSGGNYPIWSPGGRTLFFLSTDEHIMAVGYAVQGGGFAPDPPLVWAEKPLPEFGIIGRNYDIAPDGKRAAALVPVETESGPAPHMVLVLNFFDELRRRARD